MRLWIAAVGKVKAGPMQELYQDYARRLSWPLTLREVEARRPSSMVDERRREEARSLRGALPAGAVLVALDERGTPLGSLAFAQRLAGWRDDGVGDLAFLIGGADGLDPALPEAANMVLCFGSMTWPHQLVRVMLVEQLYRAQQILAGHPYHRS